MRSGVRGRFSALLLAGGLQPSPLRESLRLPVLSLPLTRDETLLDRWIALLAGTEACHRVVIVVSTPADREAIEASLMERRMPCALGDQAIEVRVDPRRFRGPSGLARDLVDDLGLKPADQMLIVEAACMPPTTLAPMFDACDDGIAGVIGSSAELEPAGVYLFTRTTLEQIPKIGFHDLKEQTLPMLYAAGQRCRAAQVVPRVRRVRDRMSYLAVVEEERRRAACAAPAGGDGDGDAQLSPSARIAGTCLVCEEVIVKDGAVLHESIVLRGAVIGGGAVISRSVIGPGVRVAARSVIRGEVLPAVNVVQRRTIRGAQGEGARANGALAPQSPHAHGRKDMHG